MKLKRGRWYQWKPSGDEDMKLKGVPFQEFFLFIKEVLQEEGGYKYFTVICKKPNLRSEVDRCKITISDDVVFKEIKVSLENK